jgi:hypothetical protein
MAATGGSIEAITLDGRTLPVTADADGARKLGGSENEIQANGDGTARQIKTRVPWSLTGITVEIDDDRGDDEFIQALANRNTFFPIAVTFASGLVYQGLGQIMGENPMATQATTKQLDLGGPGLLTQQ